MGMGWWWQLGVPDATRLHDSKWAVLAIWGELLKDSEEYVALCSCSSQASLCESQAPHCEAFKLALISLSEVCLFSGRQQAIKHEALPPQPPPPPPPSAVLPLSFSHPTFYILPFCSALPTSSRLLPQDLKPLNIPDIFHHHRPSSPAQTWPDQISALQLVNTYLHLARQTHKLTVIVIWPRE